MARSLGELIREAREARGWSISGLASAAKVDRAMVSHIEKGRMTGSVETVVALADVLGIDLNLLKPSGLEDQPTAS